MSHPSNDDPHPPLKKDMNQLRGLRMAVYACSALLIFAWLSTEIGGNSGNMGMLALAPLIIPIYLLPFLAAAYAVAVLIMAKRYPAEPSASIRRNRVHIATAVSAIVAWVVFAMIVLR